MSELDPKTLAVAGAASAAAILFALRQWLSWSTPSDVKAARELRDELRVQNAELRKMVDELRLRNAALEGEAALARADLKTEHDRCTRMIGDFDRRVLALEEELAATKRELKTAREVLDIARRHFGLPLILPKVEEAG